MKMTLFTKELLVDELDLPYNEDLIILDEIVETGRWSIMHRIIFKLEDKHYETLYSVGATELQDERPWEYIDEIKCFEVEPQEVTVTQWVHVE